MKKFLVAIKTGKDLITIGIFKSNLDNIDHLIGKKIEIEYYPTDNMTSKTKMGVLDEVFPD